MPNSCITAGNTKNQACRVTYVMVSAQIQQQGALHAVYAALQCQLEHELHSLVVVYHAPAGRTGNAWFSGKSQT